MINLLDVYDSTPEGFSSVPEFNGVRMGATAFLFELLYQRPEYANISHRAMPTIKEHAAFVHSRPYRVWYLIVDEHKDSAQAWLGAIYATHQNEIGIAIDKDHRRRGYAAQAITALTLAHQPLDAIPGKRQGHWVAHVAVENEPSHRLFKGLGSKRIAITYRLP